MELFVKTTKKPSTGYIVIMLHICLLLPKKEKEKKKKPKKTLFKVRKSHLSSNNKIYIHILYVVFMQNTLVLHIYFK